ncbi:hypothetical protein FRC12_005264 [Ceratobasidium sp. 428]|nr:hypothetical protein FRC12_005264 [Ceratobasidium sp. 428]
MAPSRPYVCACRERDFTSQRALTVHENTCPVIAERDRARFVPYQRRARARDIRRTDIGRPVSVPLDEHYGPLQAANNLDMAIPTNDFHQTPGAGPSTIHDEATPVSAAPSSAYPSTRSRARQVLRQEKLQDVENYRDTFDALPEAPPPLRLQKWAHLAPLSMPPDP